jgi:hypothetical protein
MRNKLFNISESEKNMILEMHRKATKSNYNNLSLLYESKQTELQAKTILIKNGVSEDVANKLMSEFVSGDKSINQVNLPIMSVIYVKTNNSSVVPNIINIVNEYDELVKKQRIKRVEIKKGELFLNGEKNSGTLIDFSNAIHSVSSRYKKNDEEKILKKKVEGDVESVEPPIFSNENVDIHDANTKEKCIKYVQKGLTGKYYTFCIGQFGSQNMYQSYRDSQTSTFYFIVDKTRIKDNEDGSVNLDDPLHLVVYDVTQNGIELTDANNTTGTISEFGTDVKGYNTYLQSLGVPIDILKNRPKSEQEKEEDRLLGERNNDLKWFKDLSYEYKSKYIGRGHILTDEQFDYLWDNSFS